MFTRRRFDVVLKSDSAPDGEHANRMLEAALGAVYDVLPDACLKPFHEAMNRAAQRGAWLSYVPSESDARGLPTWRAGDREQSVSFGTVYETPENDDQGGRIALESLRDGFIKFEGYLRSHVRERSGADISVADVCEQESSLSAGKDADHGEKARPLPLLVTFSGDRQTILHRATVRALFGEALRDISGNLSSILREHDLVPGRPQVLGEDAARCANEGRGLDEYSKEPSKTFSLPRPAPALFCLPVRRLDGQPIANKELADAWTSVQMELSRTDIREFIFWRIKERLPGTGIVHTPEFNIKGIEPTATAWRRWRAEKRGKPVPAAASQEARNEGCRILKSFETAWAELLPAARKKESAPVIEAGNEFRRLKRLNETGGLSRLDDREMRQALLLNARLARTTGGDIALVLPGKDRFLAQLADKADAAAAALPRTMHTRQRER